MANHSSLASSSTVRSAILLAAAATAFACSSRSNGDASPDGGRATDSGRTADAKTAADAIVHAEASADAVVSTAASLTSLSVKITSPASAADATLVPPFSPSIHDYYVRCGAGVNTFRVTMQAAANATAAVVQPTPSAAATSQTVDVSVPTSAALVVAATSGKTSVEYWVRCLPADFPPLQMTAHPDAGAAAPGYYLVGNTTAPTNESSYAMVLDGNGVPVWYDLVPSGSVYNVSTVLPGVISYIGPISGLSYENHQLDPLQTTFVKPSGIIADEHELQVLPNGNLVLFTSVLKVADLTGLTLPLQQGGTVSFGPDSLYLDCLINEVTRSGTTVWTWDAADHFDLIEDMSYRATPCKRRRHTWPNRSTATRSTWTRAGTFSSPHAT